MPAHRAYGASLVTFSNDDAKRATGAISSASPMDILLRASSVRQGQVQGMAASSADTEGAVLSFRVCGPSIPCRCRYPQGSSLTVSRNGNLLEMVMNCSSVTFI